MNTFWKVVRWAVWISGSLSTFLIPPHIEIFRGGSAGQINLTQFIMAVVMALLIVVLTRLTKIPWWSLWLVGALGGYGVINRLINYQDETSKWVKTYNGNQFVIGTVFMDRVYPEDRKRTPEQLLADNGVQTQAAVDNIWTHESIYKNIKDLSWAYILLLSLVTVTVVSLGKILPDVEDPPT